LARDVPLRPSAAGLAGSGRVPGDAWRRGSSPGAVVPQALPATAGRAGWSGGQHPGAIAAGQSAAGRLRRFTAAVRRLSQAWFVRSAVAELEAAPPPGGDLGDGPLDVGPARAVVLGRRARSGRRSRPRPAAIMTSAVRGRPRRGAASAALSRR
jgi:hypothetical protein